MPITIEAPNCTNEIRSLRNTADINERITVEKNNFFFRYEPKCCVMPIKIEAPNCTNEIRSLRNEIICYFTYSDV